VARARRPDLGTDLLRNLLPIAPVQ
jgi:hypothetical protein